MKTKILHTLLLAILFVGCEKEKVQPIIGKEYTISFDLDEKDPFRNKDIDTVKIIGLKGGYVQWQYKKGYKQSASVRLFNKLKINTSSKNK